MNEKTVKSYFDILEATLLGYKLTPYTGKAKRDTIFKTPKFYFFDVGGVTPLKKNHPNAQLMETKKHSLESYIFQEVNAYINLTQKNLTLNFWRTTTGKEVDFILNGTIEGFFKYSFFTFEGTDFVCLRS